MTKTRRLLAGLSALALAAGLASMPSTSSQALSSSPRGNPSASNSTSSNLAYRGPTPVQVVAESLPKGKRPQVAFLEGRTLHLPNGSAQTLPFPKSHAGNLDLLGPSPRGWIVLDQSAGVAKIYRVKNGNATKFWSTSNLSAYSWRLGFKGNRVMQIYTDRSSISFATTIDLSGKHGKTMQFNGYATLLAFTGDRAVVSGSKTWDWLIGSPKSAISTDAAVAADIRKNLVFLPDAGSTGYGPTTLGLPDEPEWAENFRARSVSPDGSYVVGLSYNEKQVEIRDMVDGYLVRSFAIKHRSGLPLLWETDSAVVMGVKTMKGYALVRCPVSGACKRATAWSPLGRPISVSFETNYFGDSF